MTGDGVTDEGVTIWRGIRFAEPPTGDLRWHAPVPIDGVPAPDNAFGPIPVQRPSRGVDAGPGAVMDEDCLTLNVWAPASADGPLPVMVWVFGGVYTYGAAREPMYDGTRLAQDGVVVVTLNYRLGALGWLDLPALGPANLGLRDVMAALRWVRRNIGTLGGDPGNVTVFGESAGAGIISTLLTVPAAAGLFDAAICESSPATTLASPALAAAVAQRLLAELGLDAEGLRTADADAIMRASTALEHRIPAAHPGCLAWSPRVGDDLVPADPVRVLRAGGGHPVPLLIGTNRDESHAFALEHSPVLPTDTAGLRSLFDAVRTEDPGVQLPAVATDRRGDLDESTELAFRMPAVWIAEGHSAVAPVFLYRFDHATPFLRLIGLDAGHATELPYVFGTYGADPTDPSLKLGGRHEVARISARMRERWTGFARERSPQARDAAAWPPYDSTTRASLEIGRQDRVVHAADADARAQWGEQVDDLLPPG